MREWLVFRMCHIVFIKRKPVSRACYESLCREHVMRACVANVFRMDVAVNCEVRKLGEGYLSQAWWGNASYERVHTTIMLRQLSVEWKKKFDLILQIGFCRKVAAMPTHITTDALSILTSTQEEQ